MNRSQALIVLAYGAGIVNLGLKGHLVKSGNFASKIKTNSYKYLHSIVVIEDKTGRMGTLTCQLSYTCTKPLNKKGSAECSQSLITAYIPGSSMTDKMPPRKREKRPTSKEGRK